MGNQEEFELSVGKIKQVNQDTGFARIQDLMSQKEVRVYVEDSELLAQMARGRWVSYKPKDKTKAAVTGEEPEAFDFEVIG
jgi:hypothetical protein